MVRTKISKESEQFSKLTHFLFVEGEERKGRRGERKTLKLGGTLKKQTRPWGTVLPS